jgi:hypothetical protein
MMILLCEIKVFLEVMVAELVAILILAVLVAVDLYGVIGEMYKLIFCITELELVAAGSNITLVVPVSLSLAILSRKKVTKRTKSM